MLKGLILRSTLVVFICSLSFAAHAIADPSVQVNVPAGDLGNALATLAKQSGVEFVYQADQVRGLRTGGVKGTYTAPDAVRILLKGTPLELRTDPSGAMLIAPPRAEFIPTNSQQAGKGDAKEGKKDSSEGFRVAQATAGQAAGAAAVEASGEQGAKDYLGLQEVIVTAQKREERLQDVPVPVTALSAEALLDANQLRLQDYYTRVPGLSLTSDDFGTPLVAIRGLTTGVYTNPTVGFVVDDVPYGSSSALANGQQVPDIDPSDLVRVEVLRGPQGTLYGASSLGGLIKYVTIDPSTEGVSGRVQAGADHVYNGEQLGYNVRGSINVPLSGTLAVRASGFTRRDPGYIDNIQTGEKGVNSAEVYGGRLSALWRPSTSFSLKLSALAQDGKLDGSSYVDLPVNGYVGPPLGDLQQNDLRDTGWLRQSIRAFSANLTAKLGSVDLVSITGYNVNRISDSFDATPFYSGFAQATFGVTGSPLVTYNTTYKFTQEVRLAGSFGRSVDWLVGGFYNHENSPGSQDTLATDPATGALAGVGVHYYNPSTFEEYAGFADLTFHFAEHFDVQVGGRESENRQTLTDTRTGPYFPPFSYPAVESKDNSFTYLLTPRLRLSPDLIIYARFASGYRPGGPNAGVSGSIPTTFEPDKTQNYEIGAKGDVLSHALSFDVSLYRIDWKNIQLFLIDPVSFIAYNANGSRAKSQGAELSIDSRPIRGLTISAWGAWNDAKLTEPLPPTATVQGAAGDRLPYSSRFSGDISLDDEFPLTQELTGFAGASVSYVGDRQGIFVPVPPRQTFPPYAKTDLRGGVKYKSWTVNVFVNNVADKRGVLNGGIGTFIPWAFQYIQPRTVGLSIIDTF